jgi:hypothetical protein
VSLGGLVSSATTAGGFVAGAAGTVAAMPKKLRQAARIHRGSIDLVISRFSADAHF